VPEPHEAIRGAQDRRLFAGADLHVLESRDAQQARRDPRAQPCVPADGRQGDQVERFGSGEEETERERVVDVAADVGVEQDPTRQG
jgi:hypothetical protein